MSGNQSKKIIIDRLREAKSHQHARIKVKPEKPEINPSEFLPTQDEVPELEFAKNLVAVKGKFTFCTSSKELMDSIQLLVEEEGWKKIYCTEKGVTVILSKAGIEIGDETDLSNMEVAITGCEYLISRTGSVMVSSGQGSGRRVFGYAPIHVVIANTKQLVPELSDAFKGIKKRYHPLPSQISVITGPSRTADIEKTLVMGAHGPRDFYVFLVSDQPN